MYFIYLQWMETVRKKHLRLQNYEQQFNIEGRVPQIRPKKKKKFNAPSLERSDMSPVMGMNMKLRNRMHIT